MMRSSRKAMNTTALITITELQRSQSTEYRQFLHLSLTIYGDSPRTRNDIAKTRDLLKIVDDGKLFLARREGTVVGRMCCSSNRGIVDAHGNPYGMVGLFESIDDYQVFAALMNHARVLFRERTHILFPFFKSTWHQYRLVSEGDDRFHFFMEPHTAGHYTPFMHRYGADSTYTYYSYLNRDVDSIIADNRHHYDRVMNSEIVIRPLDRSRILRELSDIHAISTVAFSRNPFYTDIPRDEFVAVYRSSLKLVDRDFCTIIEDGKGNTIGYYFSIPDFTPLYDTINLGTLTGKVRFLMRRRSAVRGIIIKTVAILPEYRQYGIHGAATCHHALLARDRGYQYVIAALIHEDNPSIQTIKERSEQKEYQLYSIKINDTE